MTADPEFLSFAYKLAAAARVETLSVAARGKADNKASDGSFDPVTEADRAAERAMRSLIAEAYPDHGIGGEEFGDQPGAGPHRWSLDPIDGTRAFICGLPSWTTLIALLEDDRPILGLIDAPRLDELYGGDGTTAWCARGGEREALRVSECRRLEDARLSTTDPYLFSGAGGAAFAQLRARTRTTRYGLDAYAYARLAAGTVDLVVECGLKPHDYYALIPVVRGAGGVFGDWSGGGDFSGGNVIAAATAELYEAAVEIMAGGGAAEAPR